MGKETLLCLCPMDRDVWFSMDMIKHMHLDGLDEYLG